jgi:hypothetical protein
MIRRETDLQVGLVDTSETLDNNSGSTEETGLQGGVLAGRSLAVVLVSDYNPSSLVLIAVLLSDLRHTSPLATVWNRHRHVSVGVFGSVKSGLT